MAQCWFCNLFMSYKSIGKGVSWIPNGGPTGTEPQTKEHAHMQCWRDASRERKQLINKTAWVADEIVREEGK